MIASTLDPATGELSVEWTTDNPAAIHKAIAFAEAIREADYADDEPEIAVTHQKATISFFLWPFPQKDLETVLASIDRLAATLLTIDDLPT